MEYESKAVPVILGRPFMKSASVVIDVRAGTTTLGVGRKTVTLAMDGTTIDNPLIHSLKGVDLVVAG